jgi:hypothetical protein
MWKVIYLKPISYRILLENGRWQYRRREKSNRRISQLCLNSILMILENNRLQTKLYPNSIETTSSGYLLIG